MSYTDILKTIPTIQATGLATHNLAFLSKKRKRVTAGSLAGLGVTNIVGTALIHEQAKLI